MKGRQLVTDLAKHVHGTFLTMIPVKTASSKNTKTAPNARLSSNSLTTAWTNPTIVCHTPFAFFGSPLLFDGSGGAMFQLSQRHLDQTLLQSWHITGFSTKNEEVQTIRNHASEISK